MINKNLVFLDEDVLNASEAIDFLVESVANEGLIGNKLDFKKSVWERENDMSTSVGYGIAMPHGKDDSVDSAFVAYLRPKSPFIWDLNTKDQVNSIFLIGVPGTGGEMDHLKIISSISKSLIHESFRQELLNASNVNDCFKILKEVEEKEN